MIEQVLKKKVMIMIGIIIFFVIGGIWLLQPKKSSVQIIEKKEPDSTNNTFIEVDLKGAVKSPGVYKIEEGARVKDVIEKAGGFLETAESMTVNLSKRVVDEMVIIIYTKEEVAALKEEEVRTVKTDQTCICPKIENGATVKDPVTNHSSSVIENGKISINHATQKELEILPGIGASKASSIISYREEHGPFASIEEIKKVSGIGDATFEKIKNYLTL